MQTTPKTIERCLLMSTDPGDLVLDPTCGSGTTAYVAEQWGRRWITVDTSRVALALARTGRSAEARKWLDRLRDVPRNPQESFWDLQELALLQSEAESLLLDDGFPRDPS